MRGVADKFARLAVNPNSDLAFEEVVNYANQQFKYANEQSAPSSGPLPGEPDR